MKVEFVHGCHVGGNFYAQGATVDQSEIDHLWLMRAIVCGFVKTIGEPEPVVAQAEPVVAQAEPSAVPHDVQEALDAALTK
jgi:hypothetical protein